MHGEAAIPSRRVPSRQVAAAVVVAVGACIALLMAKQVVNVNMARTCITQDTPYFDLCPALPWGSAGHLDHLRSRIDSDPGDANAYVQLAMADRSAQRPKSIDAAQRVAPNQRDVVLLQAAAALDKQDLPQAVGHLIQLSEYWDNTQASFALARLIGAGQGNLLSPHIQAGSLWFTRVMAQMPQAKAAFSTALPLVAQALKAGILDAGTVNGYIRQLKASGSWADAYGLWLSLHGKPLPVLYNGGFEEAFQADGFDWEPTSTTPASKAGAIIERRGAEQRGTVLDIRFTGRALAIPLVRQYLYLGPGRYRLRGEFMARQLRMEQGLAWSVNCTAAATQTGRSAALGETGGAWQPFEFEFSIPAGCGLASSLQLETFAPFEAALGARGRVAFDSFSLEKLRP